jgi:hypothetical protein
MKILILPLIVLFLASCSTSIKDSDNNSQKALTLVKKVCDGDNKLSWKRRANLAAQANYLDKRWERLADATYVQAALSNFADYPEPALTKVYESKVEYAKALAECSILELIDKE